MIEAILTVTVIVIVALAVLHRIEWGIGPKDEHIDYDQIRLDLDKACAPGRQQVEDQRVWFAIRQSAYKAYVQWRDAEFKHKIFLLRNPQMKQLMPHACPIIIFDPTGIGTYTIHDETTAKYKNKNLYDLIGEEFQKLKEKHVDN